MQAALDAALAQPFAHDPYIVVLGDLGATRGILQTGKLAEWYTAKWKLAAEAKRPHTYVFAIGDDANLPLGRMLARDNGVLESVRSTEPIEFKLKAFLSKIGRKPVDNLQHTRLTTSTPANFDLIYPLEETVFRGSMQTWVGEYKKPAAQATFTAQQTRASVALPAQNTEHEFLPRAWGEGSASTLCSTRSNAGGRGSGADRSRSFVSRGNVQIPSLLTRLSWQLRAPSSGPRLDSPRRSGASGEDRRIDHLGGRDVSLRCGEEAALSRRRRYLQQTLFPRAERFGRRHVSRSSAAARQTGTHVPRIEDLRHRKPAASRQGEARSQTNASRRNCEIAKSQRLRIRHERSSLECTVRLRFI